MVEIYQAQVIYKRKPYLEGCFSCLMSGCPRSTLDKTSPSKPDNVVQFILFPEDKCNATVIIELYHD
jgi:hypothetical protein